MGLFVFFSIHVFAFSLAFFFCRLPICCSGLLLVSPPQLLLDLRGQRAEEVLLHNDGAALQQPTLAQLHREALKPVPPQLQLGQAGQLSDTGGHGLQAVVAQVQGPQLPTLEQLGWESLNLKHRNNPSQLQNLAAIQSHWIC